MEKKYPFKFLDSYNQNDTDMFFGRDEEIATLYEMVFQNSILLVYGASGTGKTSLIQCGLAGRFKSYDWLALTIRRGTNINASLEKSLIAAGGNEIDDEEARTNDSTQKLTGLLRLIKGVYLNSFKPVYLIFDQFEELYILGTKDEQEKFIEAVKEIQKAEQPVKMIFSIREEYLGHLFEFEKQVPQLLRKKLRVEPMTLNKVTDVIKGINNFKLSNVKIKADEIDAITQGIFERLRGKKKTLTIQLPYLQVFLDKLYLETTKDETRKADALIELSVLNRIGDIGDVLRNFLEEQVAGISQKLSQTNTNVTPELIWKILSPFSTLEGTKEPISKKELGERLKDIDPKLIDEAVESFVNSRILNFSESVNLYELAHDSLALRIAEKRSDEEISLLEVRRLIKNQVSLKQDAREFFSKKQLTFIDPFLHKLTLSEEEDALINESKEAEHKAEKKKRTRRKNIIISIAAATILVIGILSIFLIQASRAKNKNIELLSNSYWNNSKNNKAENDYVYSLANAAMAFSLSKDNKFKENILMEIESKWPVVSLKNIFSGKSQILSAAFIKEGKQVITISKDYSIRLWDAVTGDSIETLKGLPITEKPSIVQLTHDGKNVVTYDPQSEHIHLWNIATLKAVELKNTEEEEVFDLLPSADGSKILIITYNKNNPKSFCNINVYASNGKQILSNPLGNTKKITSMNDLPRADLSANGDSIVVKYDDNRIAIFNGATGKHRNLDLKTVVYDAETDESKVTNYTSLVKYVFFTNNGDTIMTTNGDSTVRLWDASDGMQIGGAMKHDRPVDFAFFNRDCSMIITIDDESSTFIWDTKTETKLGHAFKLEPGSTAPVFSPDGKSLLAVINGTASIWQLLPGKDQDDEETYNEVNNDFSHNLFFSPDLKKMVTITKSKKGSLMYSVFDAENGNPIGKEITSNYNFDGGYYSPMDNEVWFSPDSKRLLTRYNDDSIQLWNADLATRIGGDVKGIPLNLAGKLVFSPIEKVTNGSKKKAGPKKLITKYEDDTLVKLQLWNIEIGKKIGSEIAYKKNNPGKVQYNFNCSVDSASMMNNSESLYQSPSPVFSADGNWVFTFFINNDSIFYELFDARTRELKGPRHILQTAQLTCPDLYPILSPDGALILTRIEEGTAQLLEAETGKQKADVIKFHPNWHPLYGPDGKWLLICASDNTAQFIDINSRAKKGDAIKHLSLSDHPLINADGSRVLTIGNTGTYLLWNAQTQKQIKEDFKHESNYIEPVFSPDGKLFITTDYWGTARLYNAETGDQKGPALNHPKSEIVKVVFSEDAKKVLIVCSGVNEYKGVIWDVSTGKQIGQELKDVDIYDDLETKNTPGHLHFSNDAKWLLYKRFDADLLLNTEAGDLDIPADLLNLQVLMSSGYRYDFAIDEKNVIAPKEFYGKDGIMEKYNARAKAHYEKCKFTQYNFWKRFNEEEAKKVRPDDFVEKNKKDTTDSQFKILPAFNTSDTSKANNGSYLEPGQAIYSNNKKYLLAYQADGNLVIYRKQGMAPVWASNTSGYPAYRTVMQYDGNLVIYADVPGTQAGNNAIWSSDTWEDNAGARLVLEDNGKLVIYSAANRVVWDSISGKKEGIKK